MSSESQKVYLYGVGGLVMGRPIAVIDEEPIRMFSLAPFHRSLVERAASLLGGDVRLEAHYAKNKIRPFYDLFAEQSSAGRFFTGPDFLESIQPYQVGDPKGCVYFFLGTHGIIPKNIQLSVA